MSTSYSYLDRLADAHDYKWFGLNGLKAMDSLVQYGIAARCLNVERLEYECYAPDPDEEDCSIYFVTNEGYIEDRLQNSPQLSKFMFEKRITLRDFMKLQITEQLHLLCAFFNIIDFLELNIDECYERDMIVLGANDNPKLSSEEISNEHFVKLANEEPNIMVTVKNPILVEAISDNQFAPLLKAIQTVVDDFGNGIVLESGFVNILDDYHAFKGIPGVKRIFRIIAENGYLSDWTDENSEISTAFIAKTAKSIALKYGFDEEWVKYSVTSIFIALGYATTEVASKNEIKCIDIYPSELYASYNSYSKICRSYKYNEINKDNYLPDRKGVLYSTDKKALVFKGDFSQSSYSIRQGTMYIASNAWDIAAGSPKLGIDLYIPKSVVAIGSCAFSSIFVNNLDIPSSVKFIDWMAFYGIKTSSISLHDGLEYIGHSAFQYSDLINIILPKTLKYVGSNAFPNGIKINNYSEFLSVKDGIIYNREETFLMCCTSNDSHIFLPNTVEEINSDTFSFNWNLISIELGNSLRKIGCGAFSYCKNLKSISLPETLEEIGSEAFENCEELYSIEIPQKVKKIGYSIFKCCSSLSEVFCHSPYFEVENDALYDVKKKILIAYFGIDREYVVKRGTKIIGDNAFRKVTSLKKITLPKSVISVGFMAFEECTGLEEVRALNPNCEFDDCGIDENIIMRVIK